MTVRRTEDFQLPGFRGTGRCTRTPGRVSTRGSERGVLANLESTRGPVEAYIRAPPKAREYSPWPGFEYTPGRRHAVGCVCRGCFQVPDLLDVRVHVHALHHPPRLVSCKYTYMYLQTTSRSKNRNLRLEEPEWTSGPCLPTFAIASVIMVMVMVSTRNGGWDGYPLCSAMDLTPARTHARTGWAACTTHRPPSRDALCSAASLHRNRQPATSLILASLSQPHLLTNPQHCAFV